jgi:hypothetical protein
MHQLRLRAKDEMIAEIITPRQENAELWEFVRSTFLEPMRADQ